MTSFSAADFWVKGRLFINRALEQEDVRSEDERRLWATLALEVLAKWALTRHSPTLVADPEKGGGAELSKALGLKEGIPEVSITATTAFKRCETLYRHFSSSEASKFSAARNEYVHGTGIELLNLPGDAWWSRYCSLIAVLLTAHGTEMAELVGPARRRGRGAPSAQCEAGRTAGQNSDRRRPTRSPEPSSRGSCWQPTPLAGWQHGTSGQRSRYRAEVECPACGSYGTDKTDIADDAERYWSGDPDEPPTLTVQFTPDYFSGPKCHLVLHDYDLIEEAGLAEQHEIDVEDDGRHWEADYGND